MDIEKRYEVITNFISKHFSRGKSYKLLEVGAGDCYLKKYLPSNVSYDSLDFGKENNPGIKEEHSYTYLFNLDSGPLPIESDKYDLIVCYETLEHTMYPERVIKEMLRIGKKKCVFFLSLPNEYNFVQRAYYLFGHKSMTDEPFRVVDKHLHIHKPRVKDIISLFDKYFNIREIDYVWQSSHLPILADSFINGLSNIFPSLFSRVVIVVGEKK